MKISRELLQRIKKANAEKIDIVAYDPQWIRDFNKESAFLKNKFPEIIKRIEHFGSTAIPGLSAKPVVDLLVEVKSYKATKKYIVPVLQSLGYEYFWRPSIDKPPYYAWFIKRDKYSRRTHHIHMVIKSSDLWDRLYFRDYLISHPNIARQYEEIKLSLMKKYANDREAYTKAKTNFVVSVTRKAKNFYLKRLSRQSV